MPLDPQLHCISLFMQNAEIFSFLANALINECDIDDTFESIYASIVKQTKYIGKNSGGVIDSVIDHIINISKV